MNIEPLPEPTYHLTLIPGRYAVCRLPAQAELPDWAHPSKIGQDYLLNFTWRGNETSLVCPERFVPPEIKAERGWRIFEVAGPLDFELVGVLASILDPLKMAGISVFTLSTFDTDLLLVKEVQLDRAIAAFERASHLVARAPGIHWSDNAMHHKRTGKTNQ